MRLLLIAAVALICQWSFATQTPEYACAFKNPILFGASISSGYGGIGDALNARSMAQKGQRYLGRNLNPLEDMQRNLAPSGSVTNLSEMIGQMRDHSDGVRQLQRLLATPAGKKKFAEASMLGSVDAFYWGTIRGSCPDTIAEVDYLTSLARINKKPLVLANIPYENPHQVFVELKLVGWHEPRRECVDQVNERLRQTCREANQCYLLDLKSVIGQLNSPAGFPVGRYRYHTRDIRFDGVHLTPLGRRTVADLIEAKINKKLKPSCAQAAPPTKLQASVTPTATAAGR